MVNLLTHLLLCTIVHSYIPFFGCFYNQKIKIANDTYFQYDSAGYDFGITWDQPQSNITQYTYTLVGYRSELGNHFISFNGSLVNVTNTGAVFIFQPQNGSSITYAVFSIVLVETCSGYIDLQLIQYEPVQISLPPANRTANTEYYLVPLSKPMTKDTFNYRITTHLSAFYLTEAGYAMHLSISVVTSTIKDGANFTTISLTSSAAYANVYERIWFTFILVHIPSFTEQISSFTMRTNYVGGPAGKATNVDNFYVPWMFNQGYLNKQCVISFVGIWAYTTSGVHEFNPVDSSTSNIANVSYLIANHVQQVQYQVFCIQQCLPGYFVIYNWPQPCGKCWDFSYACEVCTYTNFTGKFVCYKCFNGSYLLAARNRCYGNCPSGYYNNVPTQRCLPCNSACITCADKQNCTSCLVGWPVKGGCTTIQGCLIALSPAVCSKCNGPGMFYMVSRTCKCLPGYFLVTHVCTNVSGCVGATISQNTTVCLLCDSMKGYVMGNGVCVCKEGFAFNGSFCIEICGDSLAIIDECDDGNNVSGDGCNSVCKIEKNYRCTGGSVLSPSKCIYQRSDITLSVAKITKNDLLSQGIFTFSVTPAVGNMAKMNFTKLLTFSCNQSISIGEVSYQSGKLKIIVDFSEDLQGNPANITLELDSNYFLQKSATLAFGMISSGAKLILTGDIAMMQLCKMMLTGVSMLAVGVFVASTFVHKMIGVELLFPLQLAYFVHLVNEHYLQTYGLLKYLGFSSWHFLSPTKITAHVDSARENLSFSSTNQQLTISVVAGLSVLAMIAFAVAKAVQMAGEQETRDLISKKGASGVQRVLIFLYRNILFPWTIAFLSTFMLICNTLSLHQAYHFSFVAIVLLPLFMVTLSLVFFFQWRALIFKESISAFQGLSNCSKRHVPVYLTIMLLASALLSFSYQHPHPFLAIAATGITLAILTWMIVARPYDSIFHNVGVIINILPSAIFLTFDVLRNYKPTLQTESTETLFIFAMIGSAALSSLISISRIAFEVRTWKKMEEAHMQKKVQIKEAKLKRKQQLLDKLEKMKEECRGKDNANKDIDIAYLAKFRKEKDESSPKKLKGETLSAISVAFEKSREEGSELKKKIRNKFGQMVAHNNKRKNIDPQQ